MYIIYVHIRQGIFRKLVPMYFFPRLINTSILSLFHSLTTLQSTNSFSIQCYILRDSILMIDASHQD